MAQGLEGVQGPSGADAAVGIGRPESQEEDEDGGNQEKRGQPEKGRRRQKPFLKVAPALVFNYFHETKAGASGAAGPPLPFHCSPTFWGGRDMSFSSSLRKRSSMKPSSLDHQIQTSSFQRMGFSSRKKRKCWRMT